MIRRRQKIEIAEQESGTGRDAVSLHTFAHIDCPACEELRAMLILDPSLCFSVAVKIWLTNHEPYIKPGTRRVYRQYASALSEFLGTAQIDQIHIGNIRAYQRWRLERAGASRVNCEVQSVLKPILREIERWDLIANVYHPLPVPKTRTRQNMDENEERRFMACALDASKPRRLLAGHCLLVMANTGMGFGELRHLKREDVDLSAQIPYATVNPEGAKNEFRVRTIPLNWFALRSMRWIIKRWEDLGGTEPTQYILPHNAKRSPDQRKEAGHARKSPPDFNEPMGHIYRAARGILKDAGLPHLDPYDMRSHFGNKLMGDPDVSDQMFQEIFGHSNTKTRARYSNQRLQKKAVVMEKMALDPAPAVRLIAFPGGKK